MRKTKDYTNHQISKYVKGVLTFNILLFTFFLVAVNTHGQEIAKTTSIFDGKTLEGWETVKPDNMKFWTVKDSVIIGGDGSTKIPENIFLHTQKKFENFEFRCLFRLTGDPESGMINSGIQYRSVVDGDKMIGYQADIGNGFWGDIYDEHRRALLVKGDLSTLKYVLEEGGWNSYIIRVRGNHHTTYINGVKVAEYIEDDPQIPSNGVIGFQLHSGGTAKVELRNLTITELTRISHK